MGNSQNHYNNIKECIQNTSYTNLTELRLNVLMYQCVDISPKKQQRAKQLYYNATCNPHNLDTYEHEMDKLFDIFGKWPGKMKWNVLRNELIQKFISNVPYECNSNDINHMNDLL